MTTARAPATVPFLVTCVSLLVTQSLVFAHPARAEDDWGALDSLFATAEQAGLSPQMPAELDVGRLQPRDALIIIGPREKLPVAGLAAFLRAGGRIALLDDYGPGDRLLEAYQIRRERPTVRDVPRLREDERLLVAEPASEHALTAGVPALLTNNASRLFHNRLQPVFSFGRSDQALMLAGAVGAGRLIAAGDASLFINQHMVLPAHRTLAENLLRYLAAPSGQLVIAGPETRLFGNFGQRHRPGFERLNNWLGRVARPDLPASALAVLGLALAAITLVFAAGALPRRSPYLRTDLFPKRTVWAGFAGRVTSGQQPGVNLLWTALDYKHELQSDTARLLGLDGPFHPSAAVVATARRAGDAHGRTLRGLLKDLDELAAAEDRPEGPPRVSPDELQDMVRKGETVLEALERATERA